MEQKEIEIGTPIVVAGITLIPVSKVSVNYWHANGAVSSLGVKQPVGVVVASLSGKRAYRITGKEIPLDQFVQEVPEIKEVLEGI